MTERVQFTEINNTNFVRPNIIPLSSVLFGDFKKGQAFTPILIKDGDELLSTFGEPVKNVSQRAFFNATDYLKYVSPLLVVRTLKESTARNSSLFVYQSNDLDVSTITNTTGDTWRYTFNGTPDLSTVNVGEKIITLNATNVANDGTFIITAVNDTSDYIEIINSSGIAEATDSPCTAVLSLDITGNTTTYVSKINDTDSLSITETASSSIRQAIFYALAPSVVDNGYNITLSSNNTAVIPSLNKTTSEVFNGITLATNERYFIVSSSTTVLYKTIVSLDENGVDENGTNIFIDDILGKSPVIRSKSITNTAGLAEVGDFIDGTLGWGFSEPMDANADAVSVLEELGNKDKYNPMIVLVDDQFSGTHDLRPNLITFATDRQDVTAIITPDISEAMLLNTTHTPAELQAEISAKLAIISSGCTNLSYAAAFYNDKRKFDKFNKIEFIGSMVGEVAGKIMSVITDRLKGYGKAVAGYTEGQLYTDDDIVKKWNADDRTVLAKNRVNPIIKMPKYTNFPMTFDYLTMINEDSVLNKLSVRFTLNAVKKDVRPLGYKYLIFDKNRESNNTSFNEDVVNIMDRHLKTGAITDYVVKNKTNDDDLDENTSRWLIGMKFPGLIRIVYITMVSVGQSVDMDERIGQI